MGSGRGQRTPERAAPPGTGPVLLALALAASTLLVLPLVPSATSPGLGPSGPGHARILGGCTGPLVGGYVNGTLTELGNTTPIPAVAGVNLTVVYAEQVTVTPSGHPATERCTTSSATGTTDALGRFAIPLVLPPGGCNAYGCTEYSGPFAPESVALADAAPAGYFLTGNVTSPLSHLALVAAFDRLGIDPAGPKTVSVGDPVLFRADAYAADGAPSPATITAAWSVLGPGWVLSSPERTSTELTAVENAGPTTLGLLASATYLGHAIPALRATDALNAVATSIDIASASPTRLDAGSSATFTLLGRGSEGYNYSATVDPGAGASASVAPCVATLIPGGEVEVACSVVVPYPRAGAYQPVANLTNGYSVADWRFPTLTVSSTLELALPPGPVLGYTGAPIVLVAGVANATGNGPYGPACLDDGLGGLQCEPGPGPSWRFVLTYSDPGAYTASFHVEDASGANASRPLAVTVGTPPRVEDLAADPASIPMHTPDSLVATVRGGVGPIEYWWNSSALPGAFAWGSTSAGRGLSATYWANGSSGAQTITLTVRDGLGTIAASSVAVYVVPGPAVSVAAVAGTPNATWLAGLPARYSLEALTPAPVSARVPDYGAEVDLRLVAGAAPASALALESALLGPVDPAANGTFVLPASAWFAGYLNFTVSAERAGTYLFALTTELPVAFAPHGTFEVAVAADLPALRLVDPVYAVGGARENHTLYHLVDPFGNPAPAGALYVTESFGGPNVTATSPIHANATGAWAWVNYSAPSDAAGVVVVRSGWGELLLGPITVPAAPTVLPLLWVSAATLAGLGAVALGASALRRRRGGGPGELEEISPEELRREAEGRSALLARIREDGPLDLDAVFDRTGPGAPSRAELTEWLASLLTERLVESTVAADGTPRIRAADLPALREAPRVEFDPSVLERAGEVPEETGPPD